MEKKMENEMDTGFEVIGCRTSNFLSAVVSMRVVVIGSLVLAP